jgi:hypothetical protein
MREVNSSPLIENGCFTRVNLLYYLSFPHDPVFHIFTRKNVIFGTLTGLGKWGFDYNWEHGIYPKS